MSPDEVIGMAIFFGSIVAILFIAMVGSIIKTWVKKDSGKNLSKNEEFLVALREFKENMEGRMSALETIVSDEDSESSSAITSIKKRSSQ